MSTPISVGVKFVIVPVIETFVKTVSTMLVVASTRLVIPSMMLVVQHVTFVVLSITLVRQQAMLVVRMSTMLVVKMGMKLVAGTKVPSTPSIVPDHLVTQLLRSTVKAASIRSVPPVRALEMPPAPGTVNWAISSCLSNCDTSLTTSNRPIVARLLDVNGSNTMIFMSLVSHTLVNANTSLGGTTERRSRPRARLMSSSRLIFTLLIVVKNSIFPWISAFTRKTSLVPASAIPTSHNPIPRHTTPNHLRDFMRS